MKGGWGVITLYGAVLVEGTIRRGDVNRPCVMLERSFSTALEGWLNELCYQQAYAL